MANKLILLSYIVFSLAAILGVFTLGTVLHEKFHQYQMKDLPLIENKICYFPGFYMSAYNITALEQSQELMKKFYEMNLIKMEIIPTIIFAVFSIPLIFLIAYLGVYLYLLLPLLPLVNAMADDDNLSDEIVKTIENWKLKKIKLLRDKLIQEKKLIEENGN